MLGKFDYEKLERRKDRKDFIAKVYAILCIQLAVSSMITGIACKNTDF